MADLTLIIGNKNYSSWSLRPWLAAKAAGIPFKEVVITLDRPDTKELIARYSPSGRVPVLRHGDLTVWDSLAISEYLAETFPEAKLWPADPTQRARARAVSAEMHSGFTALRNAMPMNIRERRAVTPTADVQADIDRVCQIWRECRGQVARGAGPFLFGTFSIADAMYAPVATRFRTYGVKTDEVCTAYQEALLKSACFSRVGGRCRDGRSHATLRAMSPTYSPAHVRAV
jgi:glutathione S-transferase